MQSQFQTPPETAVTSYLPPRVTEEETRELIRLWMERQSWTTNPDVELPALRDVAEALGITEAEAEALYVSLKEQKARQSELEAEVMARKVRIAEAEARLEEAEARRAEAEARRLQAGRLVREVSSREETMEATPHSYWQLFKTIVYIFVMLFGVSILMLMLVAPRHPH